MKMENHDLQLVRLTQSALFNSIPKGLFRQLAEADDTLILENIFFWGRIDPKINPDCDNE